MPLRTAVPYHTMPAAARALVSGALDRSSVYGLVGLAHPPHLTLPASIARTLLCFAVPPFWSGLFLFLALFWKLQFCHATFRRVECSHLHVTSAWKPLPLGAVKLAFVNLESPTVQRDNLPGIEHTLSSETVIQAAAANAHPLQTVVHLTRWEAMTRLRQVYMRW
jgi:hypothetical protein